MFRPPFKRGLDGIELHGFAEPANRLQREDELLATVP